MRRRPISLLVLAFALGVGGGACKNEFQVPAGSKIGCNDSTECPPEYTCVPSLKVCVPSKDVAAGAPTLSNLTLDKRKLGRGATATLSFTVDAALAIDPQVRLQVKGSPADFAKDPASKDLSFVFTYTAAGDETQDVETAIEVVLTGANGAQSGALSGGSLAFDFTPPALSATQVGGSPARAGAPLVLGFTPTETLASAPTVTLVAGSVRRTLGPARAAASGYSLSWAPAGTEPEGSVEFRVDLVDEAGNSTPDQQLGTAAVGLT